MVDTQKVEKINKIRSMRKIKKKNIQKGIQHEYFMIKYKPVYILTMNDKKINRGKKKNIL